MRTWPLIGLGILALGGCTEPGEESSTAVVEDAGSEGDRPAREPSWCWGPAWTVLERSPVRRSREGLGGRERPLCPPPTVTTAGLTALLEHANLQNWDEFVSRGVIRGLDSSSGPFYTALVSREDLRKAGWL